MEAEYHMVKISITIKKVYFNVPFSCSLLFQLKSCTAVTYP